MGLDMYLSAQKHISKIDWVKAEKIGMEFAIHPEWQRVVDAADLNGIATDDVHGCAVKVNAAYWRKANAIHDWFVREVQGGEDECKPHYVDREQLLALKEACEQVLADKQKAPELLPTASGFFFGSTDYDQYYFEDLQSTIDIVDRCMALPTSWDFEYRSSW